MILVTGGGFIGSAIARSFGEEALILQRTAGAGGSTIEFDLTDTSKVFELIHALKHCVITDVVHTAAVTPWVENPDFSLDIDMAKTLTAICNELKVRSVVFLSGWNVYAAQNHIPYSEGGLTGPVSDYGKSKLAVEEYLSKNLHNTKLITLRLASVYGPGQMSSGLIPNLVTTALKGEDMFLSSVLTKRDYLYIDDLVGVVRDVINRDIDENVTMNIGSGESVSVLTVAQTVRTAYKKLYGKDVGISTQKDVRESVPLDNQLDITTARTQGLLKNTKTFSEGISEYMRWRKRV